MTLEEFRRSREVRSTVSALFALEQEMWEGGWEVIRGHLSRDSFLPDSLESEQRIGLGALARSREASPYDAVKLTEIDSAVTEGAVVLHYLVVLKVLGYRTPKLGSCMSTYARDGSMPSGWALVAHHYKTLPPKRFREISSKLASE